MSHESGFQRLHPALRHHIVNSLGWTSLRPLQEQAIGPVLDGDHVLLLAPTAGGKTEAAVFPLLSRMLTEQWGGLSVLYVCPLKALLNNIESRLRAYGVLVGRRVDLWHGDVGAARRRAIMRERPDLLLTTPESIEVMLVSSRSDPRVLFRDVQAVVVDELHAFAGDDRGWHLLAVLERVRRLAGRDMQRLGLSATIGNPEALLEWLAPASSWPRRVVASPGDAAKSATVQLDYVGGIRNAGKVISALYRGEKRLVFCDSRSRVEALAAELRQSGTETFVSHSSLGLDERRRSEEAFSQSRDCVIVATSTLELGIDVGDLDRVIQIDAPATVASFLQRLGRTGRRSGTDRNCLFLATSDDGFLRASGLLRLWLDGHVEPVVPPPEPFHIFAQQLLALAVQEGRIGRRTWREWLGGMPAFGAMAQEHLDGIIGFMLTRGMLYEDGGMLSMGVEGERTFGRRHFMDLMSVFISEPLFSVQHGRTELGLVHPLSFLVRRDGPVVLLLAGRSWEVTHVDWDRRAAYVKATTGKGRSRWIGQGIPLSFDLCRAIRRILDEGTLEVRLSRRARTKLDEIRGSFSWIDAAGTVIVRDTTGAGRWWTFAGLRANTTLGNVIGTLRLPTTREDNLSIRLRDGVGVEELRRRLDAATVEATQGALPVTDEAVDSLKFSACLPRELAVRTLRVRGSDPGAVRTCLQEPIRQVKLA
ncbi:MAG: DEAD/DEAH box helicase [Acidobacteria bacterium]|nr:DEAD/DEAH box helicase [Acidobacteriota bacterium]